MITFIPHWVNDHDLFKPKDELHKGPPSMSCPSYELLQLAHRLPSCYYHYHSAANHRERDDSIPREVRKRLATYLSSNATLAISSERLIQTFETNEYINQKRKILSRTIIPHTAPYHTPQPAASGLQSLPTELLCMIKDLLPPSDLISLSLSSRQLFHSIDYQLIDLRNLSFAGGEVYDALRNHGLFSALNREKYFVRKRLDRDRVRKLENDRFWKRGGGDELVCSVCVTLHPRRWFEIEERLKSPEQRKCSAAAAKVRICEHWGEDLVSLRGLKEKRLCQDSVSAGSGLDLKRCEDPSHDQIGSLEFGAPCMSELGSGWTIDRSLTLLKASERDMITRGMLENALTLRNEVEICQHVKLGDSQVLEAFDKRGAFIGEVFPEHLQELGLHLPEFEASSCEKCEKEWQFSIVDHGKRQGLGRFSLKLSVDEHLSVVKDPWADVWLGRVEGGERLKKIKAMVW